MSPTKTEDYPVSWMTQGAAALVLGAGVLHLILVPAHLAEARAQGIFFIALGIGQLGWGAAFMRNPSPHAYVAGVALATSMPAGLYTVTRFVPAPFAMEAEALDVIGVATLATEVLAICLLAIHGVRAGVAWRQPTIGPTALAVSLIVLGVGVAGAMYGLGTAMEPVAPWLGEGEDVHAEHGAEESGHAHAATVIHPAFDWGLAQ
jgi:hypothetical protein